MPAGLAAVTPDRRGRLRARLLVVLTMLVLVELVAPVDPPVAEPLAELVGPSAAAAQTPTPQFVEGMPDGCPTDPVAWGTIGHHSAWRDIDPRTGAPPTSGEGSACELTMDACRASPVSGGYLSPLRALDKTVRADLDLLVELGLAGLTDEEREAVCYESFLESDHPGLYGGCVGSTGGRLTGADPDERCTLIQARGCPSPRLARTGPTECRGIERRGWTCPAGYKPRNAFNQCYRLRPAASIVGDHPACDNSKGAPDFTVVNCRDYVAGDYLENPASADCAGIYEAPDVRLGTRYTLMQRIGHDEARYSRPLIPLPVALERVGGESGRYWCRFNPDWLSLECHILRSPACLGVGAAPALCLKRASETGGCNAIARTILCRWYQAVFASEINHFQTRRPHLDPSNHPVQTPRLSRKRAETRQAGCNPCPKLPFDSLPFQSLLASPALRARLPRLADLVENGDSDRIGAFCDDSNPIPDAGCPAGTPRYACKRTILDVGHDLDPPGLAATPELRCSKPPPPRIRFTSGHPSGQALVNSPVRVDLVAASGGSHGGGSSDDGSYVEFKGYTVKVARINNSKISRAEISLRGYWEVEKYLKLVRAPSAAATVAPKSGDEWSAIPLSEPAAGFCVVTGLPLVQIRVEELWPDRPRDRDTMRREFGREAVEWWNNLDSSRRSALTSARGLPEWSTASRSERARRQRELTEDVDGCSYNPLSCVWEPERPGYYRLTAETAWTLNPTGGVRGGMPAVSAGRPCDVVADPSGATDGFVENCGFGPNVVNERSIPARYIGLGGLRCYLHRASQNKRRTAPGETVSMWDHVNNLLASLELKPKDLGFKDDLSDVLPWNDKMGTPCTHDTMGGAGMQPQPHYLAHIQCPTLDLRIACTASPELQGQYVESRPLYMMVSEVRANTRTPS